MLPTNFKKLHPGISDEAAGHAVGLAVDRIDAKGEEELVMIDPWPRSPGARDRTKVHAMLDLACRDRGYHGLAFFWSGWS